MVSPQKYKVKFVQREREEEKEICPRCGDEWTAYTRCDCPEKLTTKYEVRWERAIYSQDGKRLLGTTVVESELYDDEKEAQDDYDGWIIAEEGELLYFDEVEVDEDEDVLNYVENLDCKGTIIDPELENQIFT
tara:strand:+ start:496 stop:894 length:399 start_codon:yes stop_codon:yes gene_type:complete